MGNGLAAFYLALVPLGGAGPHHEHLAIAVVGLGLALLLLLLATRTLERELGLFLSWGAAFALLSGGISWARCAILPRGLSPDPHSLLGGLLGALHVAGCWGLSAVALIGLSQALRLRRLRRCRARGGSEQAAAERARALRDEGRTFQRIATSLEGEGFLPDDGGRWSAARVKALLGPDPRETAPE